MTLAENQIALIGISAVIDGLQWQSDQKLRIGRQPCFEIVVNDPSLSREHAEIRATPQGWIVQDLGSSGGTLLNGVPIGKLTRKLKVEDTLQCGKLTFKIRELHWQPPEASASWSQNIKTSGQFVRVQALSQLSWEEGLRDLSLEDVPIPHAKQFLTLLRAGYHLSRIDSANELLQTLLDDTVAVLNAQRGAILLQNGTTGQLALKAFSGSAGGSRSYSNTLAQRCFSKGESFLCQDNEANQPSSGSVIRDNMTSIICALLRSPRQRLGVLHLDRGPQQTPFSQEDFKLADAIAATVSVGIESAIGVEKQREQFLQEVIELALQVMAVRDVAMAQHCQRVCAIALILADELRLSLAEKHQLKLGALLHDLGKISIPAGVTSKPGVLQKDDDNQLLAHPLHGIAIAEKISGFAQALPIIRSHHECWDGSGYPDGLKGEEIPRLARIVAVADTLDNLITEQPGQPAVSFDQALAFVHAEAGRKFDPAIVAAVQRIGASNARWTHINEPSPPTATQD